MMKWSRERIESLLVGVDLDAGRLADAVDRGVIDEIGSLDTLPAADLGVVATPADSVVELAQRLLDAGVAAYKAGGHDGVIAFGGGVLVAAVALVLVPEGIDLMPGWMALTTFLAGGICFFFIDRTLGRSGKSMGQLMAMLVDYLPEAIALGAMLATGAEAGLLLALLIGLQNFPEAFNA